MRERWVAEDRLADVLDQIVAVELDLRLVCNGKKPDQLDAVIVDTRKILQSAAAQLRDVIVRLDAPDGEAQTRSQYAQVSGAAAD